MTAARHTLAARRCALRALAALVLAAPALPAAAQQRYWYDGDQRRPLWAAPGSVADFSQPPATKAQVVRPAALVKDDAHQSPVFRDGPGEKSRPRALPGGVLVRFPPGADAAQRQAVLARHGLAGARELGEGSGLWRVDSPPGLAALELANRLYESGDFAAAAPNWWQPRAHK